MDEKAKKNFIINAIFISIWVFLIFLSAKVLLNHLLPFVMAFFVAAAMQKPAGLISEKTKLKKGTLALIMSAAAYIIFAGLCVFILMKTVTLSGKILGSLSAASKNAIEYLSKAEEFLSDVFKNFSVAGREAGKTAITTAFSSLTERFSKYLSSVVAGIVKSGPSFLISSVVALAATCYIAKDYDELKKFVKNLLGKRAENFVKIKDILKTHLGKIILGYIVLMFITFLELVLGFFVLRVKNAVFWAAVTAFIDVLPVLGVGAVLIPWAVYCFIYGNTFLGAGLIILYVITVIVRNFAQTKILTGKSGINPLFILIAMFLGLRLFGFWGLIILPVTFIAVVQYYKSEMEQETS